MKRNVSLCVFVLTVFISVPSIAADGPKPQLASPWVTESFVTFEPNVAVAQYHLRISTPQGELIQRAFDGSAVPYFQVQDFDSLSDGLYVFELTAQPMLSNEAKAWLQEQRDQHQPVNHGMLRAKGFIDDTPLVLAGNFRVQQGLILVPQQGLEEVSQTPSAKRDLIADSTPASDSDEDEVSRDQEIGDDLIVIGSQCLGSDCTSSESFGYDTLRMKENNLRIRFMDTSNSASFPTNDWEIEINDRVNGGQSHFAILDIDNETTPFKVVAGAPSNALVVDAEGDVCIGASSGPLKLNITRGDSPGIRLHQDDTDGYPEYIWDIAGNETNFFIRDVFTSSHLPFRIFAGAEADTLVIHHNNKVGIGTRSPEATLHLRHDTNAHQIIENHTTTSIGDRNMFTMKNYGGSRIEFVNTNLNNKTWQISNPDGEGSLQFSLKDSGNIEMKLSETGDLEVHNDITAVAVHNTSDRNAKENFKAIRHEDILHKVSKMEILEWNYIKDQQQTRHIGPMAQDFYAAFAVGLDDKHISTVDMDGVALASIQALNKKVEAKNTRIQELEALLMHNNKTLKAITSRNQKAENKDATIQQLQSQNEALAEKLSRIEALLQSMEN